MNAIPATARPWIPAHARTGLDVPYCDALVALCPDARPSWKFVTVAFGRIGNRDVVQPDEHGPWIDVATLPDEVATAIRDAERVAYRAHAASERRAARNTPSDGEVAAWELAVEYRNAYGI